MQQRTRRPAPGPLPPCTRLSCSALATQCWPAWASAGQAVTLAGARVGCFFAGREEAMCGSAAQLLEGLGGGLASFDADQGWAITPREALAARHAQERR